MFDQKNWEKFEAKNESKNKSKINPKNLFEKTPISRTMEWLKIPAKVQTEFRNNFLNISVDYLQYTCYNITEPLKALYSILGFSGQIDTDNSNMEINFNNNMTLTHYETRMWHAYMITFLPIGFAPIPIASVEVYNPNKKGAIKSEGKVVFYGAYFVFRDILAEDVPEVLRFANIFEAKNIIWQTPDKKPIYKRTRVDIAVDIKTKISQKWITKYIKPHKNSKHVVKPYNPQWEKNEFQSFSYIPHITKGISIRVYNKILDIKAKNKQSWYPDYGTEAIPDVTRIEIIYGWDTATQKIDTLIDYTKFRILGTDQIHMKRKHRPKSQYSPLSAYEYFKRYAKNHGKTLKEVLDDVICISMVEEQKDIEIFETNSTK